MADRLKTDPLQIEPMLELLIELDWVTCLTMRMKKGGRYVLLCDPQVTALAPLLGRVYCSRTVYCGVLVCSAVGRHHVGASCFRLRAARVRYFAGSAYFCQGFHLILLAHASA